ncbi:MAG: hypothetical protein SGI83_04800 [Bacteroidota bacterium]|nr:hypothetical protein [Bacteroidota bacterium]
MKKLILLALISSTCFVQLVAQDTIKKKNNTLTPVQQEKLKIAPNKDLAVKNNCCTVNPNTLTACAQSLFQSFKNLTAGVGVRNCHPSLNFPTVSYAMPENCFSWQTTSASMVTFSSFYIPATPEFRVIWGSVPGNFSYYGACAPDPIIFPHPGITENHVFGAKLIKQSDYRAFTGSPKDYTTMAAVPAVQVADIQQILSAYVEENGGYISTSEAANYNNMASSKGIVMNVKLRTGASVLCYIINNYDGAGTITWKEKNPACVR